MIVASGMAGPTVDRGCEPVQTWTRFRWVTCIGVWQRHRKKSCLPRCQVAAGLAEMILRGCLRAVDPRPPFRDIEVDFHDPALGHDQIHIDRIGQLRRLAEIRTPVPQKQVLDGLHGDRRAAPRRFASQKIVEHGPHLAKVDAPMRAELPVLRHHHRMDEAGADVVERNPAPIIAGQGNDIFHHQRRDRMDHRRQIEQHQRDRQQSDQHQHQHCPPQPVHETPAFPLVSALRRHSWFYLDPVIQRSILLSTSLEYRRERISATLRDDLTATCFGFIAPRMTQIADTDFEIALASRAQRVEDVLDRLLQPDLLDGEVTRPATLLAAIRHGVLNGGKRIRPFLVLESAALFGADNEAALRVAAALECIHCYSLIHDDLPAMDDDDLRRGQPTVHRAFDEATAILAGDSLLTFAFDIIADDATELPADIRIRLVRALARAAGLGGMAGGQALDLAAEKIKPDETGIVTLQAMKTGALIRFACEAGAIIGNASPQQQEALAEFGSAVGLAFQLVDDILDMTADTASLGKTAGKDEQAGKATLVSLHGMDWARQQLAGLVDQAREILHPFGEDAARLRQAASFIATRSF